MKKRNYTQIQALLPEIKAMLAEGKRGLYHNPKTILRVMQKYGLSAEICRRRKWKQMGQLVFCIKQKENPVPKGTRFFWWR